MEPAYWGYLIFMSFTKWTIITNMKTVNNKGAITVTDSNYNSKAIFIQTAVAFRLP